MCDSTLFHIRQRRIFHRAKSCKATSHDFIDLLLFIPSIFMILTGIIMNQTETEEYGGAPLLLILERISCLRTTQNYVKFCEVIDKFSSICYNNK